MFLYCKTNSLIFFNLPNDFPTQLWHSIIINSIFIKLLQAPILIVLYLFFGRNSAANNQTSILSSTYNQGTVRNKYWRAKVATDEDVTDEEIKLDRDKILSQMANSSRPFNYIGDIDPTKPQPWPETEKDWRKLHETLSHNVRKSDESSPIPFNINKSRLPQLIFYGDSITEGWSGTSFGSIPGKHRMWNAGEDETIRRVFDNNFGKNSIWGERALKQPLILGISGSRTYDFIWRVQNGEFAKSSLLNVEDDENDKDDDDEKEDGGDDKDDEEEDGGDDKEDEEDDDEEEEKEKDSDNGDNDDTFDLGKLERIYIVLMGTNNLGGGMLPTPTVEGIDAAGRAILQLHKDSFSRHNTPAAMLFSELLPRRDDFRAVKMCPPRCNNSTGKPYKSFMPAIDMVNKELPRIVDGWRKDFGNSRIVLLSGSTTTNPTTPQADDKADNSANSNNSPTNDYIKTINCEREMFTFDDINELDKYMPDRLHPNSKGYELWSHCLKKGLEVIMDHQISLKVES